MLKILFAVFLIAHGLVHAILAAAPIPNDPDSKPGAFFTASDRSWLLPQLGINASTVQWIGIILVALSTLGFVLAGLGVFGVPGLTTVWRTVAVVSSCTSLLLLILFWHPWIIVGVLIDVGILVSLLWAKWPPETW
ncbi:MAG: hypothetical protein KAJ53_09235 [Anaerolineales bacterium]|nr:hypothetical protein [Anaerolineales bacterium]